jgi:SAM-dependent methyltransferase
MQPIHDYYDQLAKNYDQDRFGNSYGRYIDAMERAILRNWLAGVAPQEVVDIGCGTGRLLDFAVTGVDTSAEMLKVAAGKFAGRELIQASLPELAPLLATLPARQFQAATCFHVFMHLSPDIIRQSLHSLAQVVRPGGCLIVDIPSQQRRALKRQRASSTEWHGNTAANRADVEGWIGTEWRIVARRGILFLPIHRLPASLRGACQPLDALLGRSPLANWSSYHVYQLQRLAPAQVRA